MTTKNCKIEKIKSKSRYVRSNSKSLGNHVVSSKEEKERLWWEGFAEKEGFKYRIKERIRSNLKKNLVLKKKSTKRYSTLFIYLLYKYSKRFVQPVVQPAANCKRTLRVTVLSCSKR